jgi:UDP-2,3-diacylglucosamine hydrolase
MALYVFSDAHLGSGPPEKEQRKRRNIDRLFQIVKADGERLVILGDLFDFWFEYRHAIPKDHHEIIFRLHELQKQGIEIHYVAGNHDFWMGDFFEEQVGITMHRDTFDMDYAGKRIHFTHGDGLARADRGYRLLKRILRNRVNIWLYRKLPPDWAIPLAKKVSGSSREVTARRDHHFKLDYEAYAQKKLRDGCDVVAVGHLHLPAYAEFEEGIYVNTGDFINHFSYARITETEVRLDYVRDQQEPDNQRE